MRRWAAPGIAILVLVAWFVVASFSGLTAVLVLCLIGVIVMVFIAILLDGEGG